MKRILALSLCILSLFLCACQPTPEVEPVPNKGDDVMGEKIHTTPVPKTPDPNATDDPASTGDPDVTEVPFVIPHIDVPEHWTEVLTVPANGTKVYIDADIEYKDAAHPVYLIKDAKEFDRDITNKMLNLFGRGFKWRPIDTTREELLEKLEKLMKADESDVEMDDMYPDAAEKEKEEAIAEIMKKLQELDPDTVWEDIKSADDIPFGLGVLTDGKTDISTDRTWEYYSISRHGTNVKTAGQLELVTEMFDKNLEHGIHVPLNELIPTPAMEKEDAIKFAQTMLRELGMEDHYELSSVTVCQTEKNDTKEVLEVGWRVAFGLKTNGATPFDVSLYALNGQWVDDSINGDEEAMSFRPGTRYERLHFDIADGELIGITWQYPQEIISIENPAVELLPFDTIKERIKKKLEYGLSWSSGAINDIHVDRIFLTYLKSEMANDITAYYYTPMWCFVSHADNNVPMQEGVTFINAIDGSFVQFNG
ncbi:MAG: hypothetical protein IKQ36_07280 [Clostridia bacterium]|nr:hypothetical protein [Clostridia bacterium]